MRSSASVQIAQQTGNSDFELGLNPGHSAEVMNLVRNLSKESLLFVINRLVFIDGINEHAAAAAKLEFLRFVALRKVYSGILVPSGIVDKFWHAFILHTEEYTNFCQRHLGEYMHHRPQDHSRSAAFEENIAARRTLEHLQHMFPGYDKQVWSEAAICSGDGDCGCP